MSGKKNEDSISVVEMDKNKYKELVKNTILLKRENENLKQENEEIQKIALDKYNEIKTSVSKSTMSDIFHNIQNNIDEKEKEKNCEMTVSSVFKKKSEAKSSCESSENHKSNNLNNKFSHKSINNSINKSNCKSKSKSPNSDEEYSSEESEFIDDSDSENNTEITSESGIYRTATTDDGINRTYKKLNDEMKRISNINNKMSNKDIANRINFLINGLRILDDLRNKK